MTKLYKLGIRDKVTWYTATEPVNYQGNVVLHSHNTSLKTKLMLSFMQFTREYRNFVAWRTPANMRPHCAQLHARNQQARGKRPSFKFNYDEEEGTKPS